MSAIDYSKWDDFEVSDDSDIECHPNVDKRSMIRWKQEQLHRERDARRTKILALKHEAEALKKQLGRIQQSSSSMVENAQTEDQIDAEIDNLEKKYRETVQQLQKLETVEKRKFTSDKLVTGFDKTAVTKATPAPKEPVKQPKKVVEKTKVIETLNPGSAGGVSAAEKSKAAAASSASADSDDSDDDEVEVSQTAMEFSHTKGFDASLVYISKHPYLATQKYSDEIMAQAFKSQIQGDEAYASNCVHQALILQYCAQLGKDGVGLFFHRIRDNSHAALKIFQNDWKDTYNRIKERCNVMAQERPEIASPAGVETIQLQAADPGTQIHITGPPADADPKIHEIFAALPEDFQEAIISGSLENVNKSLGNMSVELAEEVVRVCNQVGFLSIEGDIIDTIKGETIEGREAEMAAAAAAAAAAGESGQSESA
ncbi:cell division cycle protein 37 [Entomortierella parvispora]|uniref:Hsp90 chaperone protein kinase-targeting subunit n=1 Tax=Entomortierella parvispora TaxID=205924 RepID=A0A9P3H3R6_9FUNG|nr:cell division cycle protein 37 [Entomortierella parvispora]